MSGYLSEKINVNKDIVKNSCCWNCYLTNAACPRFAKFSRELRKLVHSFVQLHVLWYDCGKENLEISL